MRLWLRLLFAVFALTLCGGSFVVFDAPVAVAGGQQLDEEVPPGNPVIGSDLPGDIEPENDTNYGLWALVAVCLIVAGVLLVKVERWEARRISD